MFLRWSLLICLAGLINAMIALGLNGYIVSWDPWEDDEEFEKRPEIIRARRRVRLFLGCSIAAFVGGLIGAAVAWLIPHR